MNILAIDDDSFILELLEMICPRIGFPDISTAASGEEALQLIDQLDSIYDCFLVDISMPGMDGIELCKRLRMIPAYRSTPIVMLTAMTEKSCVERAFRAGASDYATKPIDLVELGARLRMSNELIRARKHSQRDAPPVRDDISHEARDRDFDLSEQLRLEGFDDVIDYDALANYVVQLSRAGLESTQVLAIRIDQVDRIFNRTSRNEFLHVLGEVADAVHGVFKPQGYMMAYAGNGNFVLISNRASMESLVRSELEVQHSLDEKNSEYDDGELLDIEVSIGNSIRPSGSNSQRARETFNRAIARAERREASKKNEATSTPGIRFAIR